MPKQWGTGEPAPNNIRPITPKLVLDGIGEVYGGTLDVESGVLEIIYTAKVFSGDETWAALNNDFYRLFPDMALGLLNDLSYCDRFPKTSSASRFGIQFGYNGNTRASIYIREPENIGVSTQAELKAWLRNNPVKVVYELAEHEIYHLSKPQIIDACVQLEYPYLDYLDMVTDRTQEDVEILIAELKSGNNPADHKGSYNASDLNRVGKAVEYIAKRLEHIGIEVYTDVKTDWTNADIPTASRMQNYLNSVCNILDKAKDYRPLLTVPKSMSKLTWDDANKIEELLTETENTITKILLSIRGYSGRLVSGVNCLP